MFKFTDSLIDKYIFIGEFHEGLARVRTREGLWGYINKKGEEVIPCIWEEAGDFSEDRAAVKDENNKWGYIDKEGNNVIPCVYKQVSNFSEGRAAVRPENNKWGYIDKDNNVIADFKFEAASDYKEEYATAVFDRTAGYIDKEGNFKGEYWQTFPFENGSSLASITSKTYCIVDKSLQRQRLDLDGRIDTIYSYSCGMYLFYCINTHKYGYLDKSFNIKIPPVFDKAEPFKENIALGFINDFGMAIISKEGWEHSFFTNKYKVIRTFKEGLAAVENYSGLWGFINNKLEEVIPCRYKGVDDFSESLAGVLDQEDTLYYINKRGNKKLDLTIYNSKVEYIGETFNITASSKKELYEKKLAFLNETKDRVIKSVKDASVEIQSELAKKPKSKKHPNKLEPNN